MNKTNIYCKGQLIVTIYDPGIEIPDPESCEEGEMLNVSAYIEGQISSNMMFDHVDGHFEFKEEKSE